MIFKHIGTAQLLREIVIKLLLLSLRGLLQVKISILMEEESNVLQETFFVTQKPLYNVARQLKKTCEEFFRSLISPDLI